MVVLFDSTLSHTGWFGGSFPTGDWIDDNSPVATGGAARSFWAQSGSIPIDQAALFVDASGNQLGGYWFNVHTNAALSGATIPSPFLITPDIRVRSFLRPPQNTDAFIWRIVVTDQPTTPPPVTPP